MNRKNAQNQKGSLILEVLLAIGVVAVVTVGWLSVSFRYLNTSIVANHTRTASHIAVEGMEIVESIARDNWANVNNGVYGAAESPGGWYFFGTSDDIEGIYTRSVNISSIYRDTESCAEVEVGGVEDPDTKVVQVLVTWQDRGEQRSHVATKYITHWMNPSNQCGEAQTESDCLSIHIEFASLGATKKQLEGVYLQNTCAQTIVVDKTTVSWIKEDLTSPGNDFSVKVEGQDVWHSNNGIGAPTGLQPSGTQLDIVDVTIPGGWTMDIDRYRFDEKLDGSQFTLRMTMADESETQVTTPGFLP